MGARKYFIGEVYTFERSRARAARHPSTRNAGRPRGKSPSGCPTAQGMNGEQRPTAKNAQERAKVSRSYNRTPKAEKTQHAPNLAHCGALEREGNRAKERNTRHRPPKSPHIKRKPMRQSKHTHERQTRHTAKNCAHHGKSWEGEREPNHNAPRETRAGTHCQQRQRGQTRTAYTILTRRKFVKTTKSIHIFANVTKAICSRLLPIISNYGRLTAFSSCFLCFPLVSSLFLLFCLSYSLFAFRNYYALYSIFRKKYEMQLQPKYLIHQHIIPILL